MLLALTAIAAPALAAPSLSVTPADCLAVEVVADSRRRRDLVLRVGDRELAWGWAGGRTGPLRWTGRLAPGSEVVVEDERGRRRVAVVPDVAWSLSPEVEGDLWQGEEGRIRVDPLPGCPILEAVAPMHVEVELGAADAPIASGTAPSAYGPWLTVDPGDAAQLPVRTRIRLGEAWVASGASTAVIGACRDHDGDGACLDDCAPHDPAVRPGTVDRIGDGIDADCDGINGYDGDGDGWEHPHFRREHVSWLDARRARFDCDDTRSEAYPGAPERDNGLDDDCDGRPEAGVVSVDGDGDGAPSWRDCDDGDPRVGPWAAERVNGRDDDCDGLVDEGSAWFDDDGDGFAEVDGDCFDDVASVGPHAEERPNGWDDDCDGAVDEGLPDAPDPSEPDDRRSAAARWGAGAAEVGTAGPADREWVVVDVVDEGDRFLVAATLDGVADGASYRLTLYREVDGELVAVHADAGQRPRVAAGDPHPHGHYEDSGTLAWLFACGTLAGPALETVLPLSPRTFYQPWNALERCAPRVASVGGDGSGTWYVEVRPLRPSPPSTPMRLHLEIRGGREVDPGRSP